MLLKRLPAARGTEILSRLTPVLDCGEKSEGLETNRVICSLVSLMQRREAADRHGRGRRCRLWRPS